MGTKIRNIYIVHHSHTDVGYTDLQERVIYSQAQNIRAAVEAQYPNKRIDDCDYIETSGGEAYYLVDLDNYDMDLKVTPNGQITEVYDY